MDAPLRYTEASDLDIEIPISVEKPEGMPRNVESKRTTDTLDDSISLKLKEDMQLAKKYRKLDRVFDESKRVSFLLDLGFLKL